MGLAPLQMNQSWNLCAPPIDELLAVLVPLYDTIERRRGGAPWRGTGAVADQEAHPDGLHAAQHVVHLRPGQREHLAGARHRPLPLTSHGGLVVRPGGGRER